MTKHDRRHSIINITIFGLIITLQIRKVKEVKEEFLNGIKFDAEKTRNQIETLNEMLEGNNIDAIAARARELRAKRNQSQN